MTTIHLHIDDIVLHGFERIDREALSAALQEALAERLASYQPAAAAATGQARANITLPAQAGSAQLGTALAGILGDVIGASGTQAANTQGGDAHG